MAKLFLSLSLFIFFATYSFSQTYYLQAQKRDFFQNNNWVGKDSHQYVYTTNGQIALNTYITYDSINSMWEQNTNSLYTYDVNADLINLLIQKWNGTAWLNNKQYNYTYDNNHNTLSITFQSWQNAQWVNTGRILQNAYVGNLSSQVVNQVWVNNAWQSISKEDRQITANKIQYSENYIWDNSLQVWKKVDRKYFQYNQDSVASITYSIPDTSNNWVLDKRTLNTYSSSPFVMTESLNQIYDITNQTWIHKNRTSFLHTSSGKVSEIQSEIWNGMWTPTSKNNIQYDTQDSLAEMLLQLYQNGSWLSTEKFNYEYLNQLKSAYRHYQNINTAWVEIENTFYTYNNNKLLTYTISNIESMGTLKPSYQNFYYYTSSVGVNTFVDKSETLTLYPVPCQNKIWIQNNFVTNEPIELRVYNIEGKLFKKIIQNSNAQQDIEIATDNLPQGIYNILVLQNSKTYHTTFSKE
ncbi:MAG: T9SS type A sorting domain-containing protein [Chitinophagaceae bacterium]